jgi:hypothetical protein
MPSVGAARSAITGAPMGWWVPTGLQFVVQAGVSERGGEQDPATG